jgi:hypothetical protein
LRNGGGIFAFEANTLNLDPLEKASITLAGKSRMLIYTYLRE